MRRLPPVSDHLPTVEVMQKLGFVPDPWQVELLTSRHPQILLNCCRQAGKSTVVAILGLLEAMWQPMSKVLIISRSHRQSRELLKTMTLFFRLLGERCKARVNTQEIELTHLSRIVSLPCREDTIRGYAHVDLIIIDEAARVPDDLYRAVRPMLAVSKGRIICLSTPYGKRGFFWNAWARGGDDWLRFEIPAPMCPRITPEFLETERRALGESWFRQEYFCSFEALEGLVYPDFAKCVVSELPKHVEATLAQAAASPTICQSNCVGGLDFGFRNPFAALWGVHDRDDEVWLLGEHYARQQPLSHHIEKIPRWPMWYADPSGANEISELNYAGFKVRKGNNALRPGIAAVTARLLDGTLHVLAGRCPNLLAEAGLYRYGERQGTGHAEDPLDEHNHALAALRYMLARIDAFRTGRKANEAARAAA